MTDREIGTDSRGDKHFIPDGDDPKLHKADPLCGCNPDPYHDEGPWWWGHHQLSESVPGQQED